MREVAIVNYRQTPAVRDSGSTNELQMLQSIIQGVIAESNISLDDLDFVCSGSCDYLAGAAFAFVEAIEAVGPFPAIKESHVEMDAAWALYEAVLKIRTGEADSALIYGFGKSSPGELRSVMSLQLDPYYLAPLWLDTISAAALQASQCLDKGVISEADMAAVVARSRANAKNVEGTQLSGDYSIDDLLAKPTFVSPLRKHDCAPITDGASVMIIATPEKAKQWCDNPVLITGLDNRIESSMPTLRDLTRSVSTETAGKSAGVNDKAVDFAELHAPFSHQEILLQRALGLGDSVDINPSGGALAANTMMAAGLDRIGHAAKMIQSGRYKRGVAHATSGSCLQHNLVAVLEASS
ncbi:MAG: lipid-transfer protein [Pseudomonadales bacterium]